MYKEIFSPETTFQDTAEPIVQLIGNNKSLVKTAQANHHDSAIESYLNSIKPTDGKAYLLILALSSSDAYGCNRNGDWFDESELLQSHNTFESSPAMLFRHHQNKDPNAAVGKTIKSFYNPAMRRVEIIVEMDVNKAPDVYNKLLNGEPVATSMGCKVRHDICSVCGNVAKTRAEYCEHLKTQMRHVFNNGSQVYAINKEPKFFDISLVFRPADRTSYVLKKVASEDSRDFIVTPSAILGDIKTAAIALGKLSTITKIIRGLPVRLKDSNVDIELIKNYKQRMLPRLLDKHSFLSGEQLDAFSNYSSYDVANATSQCGCLLTVPETFTIILAKKLGTAPSEVSPNYGIAASAVYPSVLEILRSRPDIEKSVLEQDDMYSSPGILGEIEKLCEEMPADRYLDEAALLRKAASHTPPSRATFPQAYRAWSELFRMDGGGMTETTVIPLPDGRKMVMPRGQLLQAIATSYDSWLPAPFDILSSAAFGVGMLDAFFVPRSGQKSRLSMPLEQLQRFPGVHGRIVSDESELKPFTPGIIVKTAMDYCLCGGQTVDLRIDVKRATRKEIFTKVGKAIENIAHAL